jgi:hypothetical protein
MQRLVFGLVACLAISACSKDHKKNSGPSTPSRQQEHKASECPTGLVGSYAEIGDASNTFEIVIKDGVLVIKDPDSGDIKVDGTPTIDKDNGSSTSLICKNGTLDMQVTFPNGSKGSGVMTKTDTGIHSEFSNGEKYSFQRTGNPTSPTETELKIETPAENRLGLLPALTTVSGDDDAKKCNGGFQMEYTYKQTVNGVSCTTGHRVYCSLEEYCAGLKDEALNNGCKKDQREEDYNFMCKN